MNVRAVGSYIRKQRESSRLSLKNLSGLAGVSIPYLSQIERGLRRPSADILQAIAKALRISAETLYVQAGILEESRLPDIAAAVMADQTLTDQQKQALLHIYRAFLDESGASRQPARKLAKPKKVSSASRPKPDGGAKPAAVRSPRVSHHPFVPNPRREV